MLKNPTPHQIAWFSSLRIAAVSLVFFLSIAFLIDFPTSHPLRLIGGMLLFIAGVLATSYFISIFYLRKYILRKIKVIYKTIHSKKLLPEEKQEDQSS